MRPLEGITVVALEHAVAAPLCTRQLADLGARVIKIERPGQGDFARHYDAAVNGTSSYFAWLNRGKESIELDLSAPLGQQAMDALLDRADVLVQNLGPGAAQRLGLDHATVRHSRPRLVAVDITGWGAEWRDRKAYDLLVQAEAGLAQLTGGRVPMRVGISVADIAAGMYAAQAALAALVQRSVTGGGAHCSVALFDALAEWMSQPALVAAGTGRAPAPAGMAHATIAPYGAFATSDGTELVIAVQNEVEWQAICREVLGQPELADDARLQDNPGRVAHRPEVDGYVARWARQHTVDEAERILDGARIAHARVRGIEELLTHPLLADRWVSIRAGSGLMPALLPPVTIDDAAALMGSVPELGEHTADILAELGLANPG